MENKSNSSFNTHVPIKCFHVYDEDRNLYTCDLLRSALTSIGKAIDISTLTDISIGYSDDSFHQAIGEINPNRKPSNGAVIGIAMTLDTIDNGKYSNHIVLHQNAIYGFIIENPSHEDIGFSMQTLAHECAHVYSNTITHEKFGDSLEQNSNNPYYQVTRSISSATWSEYSACLLSADIGLNPTQDFLDVLCGRLDDMEQDLTELIKQEPSNYDLLIGVAKILGNIIKYAGYFLGCLHSFDISIKNYDNTKLSEYDWFLPYLFKMEDCLNNITNSFGTDSVSESDLLEIGNIFIAFALNTGFHIGNDDKKGAFIFSNR